LDQAPARLAAPTGTFQVRWAAVGFNGIHLSGRFFSTYGKPLLALARVRQENRVGLGFELSSGNLPALPAVFAHIRVHDQLIPPELAAMGCWRF